MKENITLKKELNRDILKLAPNFFDENFCKGLELEPAKNMEEAKKLLKNIWYNAKYSYLIYLNSEIVGYVGLRKSDFCDSFKKYYAVNGPVYELGIFLDEKYKGKGIAGEASKAAISDVFSIEGKCGFVLACTAEYNGFDNEASKKVQRKLGFVDLDKIEVGFLESYTRRRRVLKRERFIKLFGNPEPIFGEE